MEGYVEIWMKGGGSGIWRVGRWVLGLLFGWRARVFFIWDRRNGRQA